MWLLGKEARSSRSPDPRAQSICQGGPRSSHWLLGNRAAPKAKLSTTPNHALNVNDPSNDPVRGWLSLRLHGHLTRDRRRGGTPVS